MPTPDPDAVALGHAFADPALLHSALTHRSAANRHNERLEFLGDSVLNFVVAAELYRRRPEDDEGSLTRLRAHLVRGETLAVLAREQALGERLQLGPGELKSGGFRRGSILADTLEAVLGAIYLDGGFEAARAAVLRLMESRLDQLPDPDSLKDAKTRLQEWLQARGLERPTYTVIEESGAQHCRRFRVACAVAPGDRTVTAEGNSRRAAEQRAASLVLQELVGS